jgi:hypothetical protein
MTPAMRRRHPTMPRTQLRAGRRDRRAQHTRLISSKNVICRSTTTSTNGVSCQGDRVEVDVHDGVTAALDAVDYRRRHQSNSVSHVPPPSVRTMPHSAGRYSSPAGAP